MIEDSEVKTLIKARCGLLLKEQEEIFPIIKRSAEVELEDEWENVPDGIKPEILSYIIERKLNQIDPSMKYIEFNRLSAKYQKKGENPKIGWSE